MGSFRPSDIDVSTQDGLLYDGMEYKNCEKRGFKVLTYLVNNPDNF